MTKSFVMGNLTRDPDYRTTASGKPVCDLCVAANDFKQNDVSFIDVTVFGNQAEHCRHHLEKGSKVLVEGHLKQDRFEDKDGRKRSRLYVIADGVTFLDSKRQESGRPEYDQPPRNY